MRRARAPATARVRRPRRRRRAAKPQHDPQQRRQLRGDARVRKRPMFGYHLKIALKSLTRNPILTTLLIAGIRLVFGDFFDMFNIKFRYGGPWTKAADAKPEQVVVIDDDTNQKLFGGANSVGKMIRVGRKRDFRVVGVMAPWRPAMRIFDLTR